MTRCQALNGNGAQCRKAATTRTTFHGDPETDHHEYGSGELPGWVAIYICDSHGGEKERERAKQYADRGDKVLARLCGQRIGA